MAERVRFTGNVSAIVGLWGVSKAALDGYTALADAGASADDLVAYAEKHQLNLTRKDAEQTVAHRTNGA